MIRDKLEPASEHEPRRPLRRGGAREVSSLDLNWFVSQFECLLREYPDEWLAIQHQEVVAHASTVAELHRQLKALGISSPFIARSHPDAWANPK